MNMVPLLNIEPIPNLLIIPINHSVISKTSVLIGVFVISSVHTQLNVAEAKQC